MTIPSIRVPADGASADPAAGSRWARLVPAPLLVHLAPSRLIGRLARYGAVSAITTGLSLSILGVLLATTSLPASIANLVASGAGIGPSYVLNRRWVWRRSGRATWRRETGPFWAMSVGGLLLSTAAAGLTSDAASGLTALLHSAVIVAASLAAYGTLWLVEFIVLERFVFADRSRRHLTRTPTTPEQVEPGSAEVGAPQRREASVAA